MGNYVKVYKLYKESLWNIESCGDIDKISGGTYTELEGEISSMTK